MISLPLHELHHQLGATFTQVNGMEFVNHYESFLQEHVSLQSNAAVIDLSNRSRLCLVGGDRARFLNGQVTNNVADLKPGVGCYGRQPRTAR